MSHQIDLRRVSRFPGTPFGPVLLWAEPAGPFLRADVHDISIQGIGLVTHQSLAAGAELSLQPAGPGKAIPGGLKASVRHVRQDGARWVVGAEFSRLLTADDMLALG